MRWQQYEDNLAFVQVSCTMLFTEQENTSTLPDGQKRLLGMAATFICTCNQTLRNSTCRNTKSVPY